MAINFPNNPQTSDTFTSGGTSWIWDGSKWNLYQGSNLVTTAELSSALSAYAPNSNPSVTNATLGGTTTVNGTATFVNKPSIAGYQTSIPYQTSSPIGPSEGDYYIDSDENRMYIYVDAITGWQAVSPSTVSPTFTGTTTVSNLTASGTVSAAALTTTGLLTVAESTETLATGTISSNVFTANFNTSALFYITTAPSANFTINVTNLPTTDNRVTVLSFFVIQGTTGYIPSAIQIGGSGQTLKWSGGSAPTPTSSSGKVDVFTFTFIRRSSAWEVFGTSDTNY